MRLLADKFQKTKIIKLKLIYILLHTFCVTKLFKT